MGVWGFFDIYRHLEPLSPFKLKWHLKQQQELPRWLIYETVAAGVRLVGKAERDKGKRGELLLRDVLREHGWAKAERGQQRHGGPDSPDVRGGPKGFHFECKFVQALNVRKALEQAVDEAPPGDVAIVAHKREREGWTATLGLDDLLTLLRELEIRRTMD